jgi:hypothetical protein
VSQQSWKRTYVDDPAGRNAFRSAGVSPAGLSIITMQKAGETPALRKHNFQQIYKGDLPRLLTKIQARYRYR